MNKLYCEIIKIRRMYKKKKQKKLNPTIPPLPPILSTPALALVTCRKKFQSEISSASSFYARELNLVSRCRLMNKLYSKMIKSSEKMKSFELKSQMQ